MKERIEEVTPGSRIMASEWNKIVRRLNAGHAGQNGVGIDVHGISASSSPSQRPMFTIRPTKDIVASEYQIADYYNIPLEDDSDNAEIQAFEVGDNQWVGTGITLFIVAYGLPLLYNELIQIALIDNTWVILHRQYEQAIVRVVSAQPNSKGLYLGKLLQFKNDLLGESYPYEDVRDVFIRALQ